MIRKHIVFLLHWIIINLILISFTSNYGENILKGEVITLLSCFFHISLVGKSDSGIDDSIATTWCWLWTKVFFKQVNTHQEIGECFLEPKNPCSMYLGLSHHRAEKAQSPTPQSNGGNSQHIEINISKNKADSVSNTF